jgi:uncharacterized membrane protein
MTDTRNTQAVAVAEADDTGATVVGAIGNEDGVQAVGKVVTDYQYAVVVAAFADEAAAIRAYESLSDAETAGQLKVDGVLVVKTDADMNVKIQKMTDHSTKTGVKWGVVGGVVLGVIFPPSIIASAATLGVAGGVIGKLRQELHKSEVGDALAGALGPNESGILALVSAGDVRQMTAAMPTATKVRTAGVDDKAAKDITAAAAEAS